jgi:hypothetical protein
MAKITLMNEQAENKSGVKFTRYVWVKNYVNASGEAKEFKLAVTEPELRIMMDIGTKEVGLLDLEKSA